MNGIVVDLCGIRGMEFALLLKLTFYFLFFVMTTLLHTGLKDY